MTAPKKKSMTAQLGNQGGGAWCIDCGRIPQTKGIFTFVEYRNSLSVFLFFYHVLHMSLHILHVYVFPRPVYLQIHDGFAMKRKHTMSTYDSTFLELYKIAACCPLCWKYCQLLQACLAIERTSMDQSTNHSRHVH